MLFRSGLPVTLTSSDPGRLLLSVDGKSAGAASIEIRIPENDVSAIYYIQAIGSSGDVQYSATAPGFAKRTATVELRPSGVLLGVAAYGPPDEKEVLQPEEHAEDPKFIASVAATPKVMLVAWTAMLDPLTKRGADITVQPLRGGLNLEMPLKSSNPAVGNIPPLVKIEGGLDHATLEFVALSAGTAVISTVTPGGFTSPSNAKTVSAVVGP